MDIVIVLLLVLINANSTVSRNVLSRRNANPTIQINSVENDLTLVNQATPTDYNKLNTDIGINTDSATQMNTNQQVYTTEPKQSSVDPSYVIIKNVPSDSYYASYEINENVPNNSDVATEKQGLRMMTNKYFDEIVTMSSFRTTVEDSLSKLLKKRLPFPHPAPDQIGQLNRDIMLPVTEPLWRFEDYDDSMSINTQVKADATSCEAQRVHCIGDTEYNQPVCVMDLTIPTKISKYYRQKGFNSLCEVTYRNCLRRYEITGKNYADHYTEDYLEFYHYGWCRRCKLLLNCAEDTS